MTLREIILKSAQQLSSQGKEEFTTEEVYEAAKRLDPAIKRTSILGSLTSLLVNISSSPYPPEQRFLERVRQGVYRIYDPNNKNSRGEK